ncbi:MAG: protein-disulfide reductase DsbD [Legionellaceae bacterium]|nr:protein-disulfide reductase DsbD [Legionellaceae bacterium]
MHSFSRLFLTLLLSLLCYPLYAAKPLPADKAFQLSVTVHDPNTLTVQFQMAPGYYLYKDRFQFTTPNTDDLEVGKISYPTPLQKTDNTGKKIDFYIKQLSIPVPVLGSTEGEFPFSVHYQGCSQEGFCYPPLTKEIQLQFNEQHALTKVLMGDTPSTPTSVAQETPLFSTNIFMTLLTFMGLGLLLAFTPCVLPMVPVLSGIIMGCAKPLSGRTAFALSLCYVLSMSVTYALLGALIAKLGANFQIIMQTPLFIIPMSVLLFLLAASLFDAYTIQLPSSGQSLIQRVGNTKTPYLRAILLGTLSTLILSPCITPPLIGALGYIAETGNIWLGTSALFCLSLGMGLPLLLIGTSAGKYLPHAGPWMVAIKNIFGLLLFGVAIELLSRILPDHVTLFAWGSLGIFTSIFIGLQTDEHKFTTLIKQTFALILLVWSMLCLVGAALGNSSLSTPLASPFFNQQETAQPLFKTVQTQAQLEKALQDASGKPLLIEFYAKWCETCRHLERSVLQKTRVLTAFKPLALIRIDVTENNPETQALLKRYATIAPPTFIFFTADGKKVDTLVGEVSATALIEAAKKTAALP